LNNNEIIKQVAKWYPEDDPILAAQLKTLQVLLADVSLTAQALEGFLVVCSRFVDAFGHDRVAELADIFQTQHLGGRRALLQSLTYTYRWVGGMQGYLTDYPVSIKPQKPAFPQFKIIGIESVAPQLYRVLDSKRKVYGSNELVKDYIVRTGRLPPVPRQSRPVRRTKPRFHWCTYHQFNDPKSTQQALQILPQWSDCQLRALIPTNRVKRSAFVAFNGDSNDKLCFHQYFYEPLAQDHPPLIGGGPQIGLQGSPVVTGLAQYNGTLCCWEPVF
jgi:hypothetical protein